MRGNGHPVDSEAAIVPGESLGGLLLGTHITDLSFIAAGKEAVSGTCSLLYPFEAVYDISKTGVSISVDVRTGHVCELMASEPYAGALFGTIRVDQAVKEAMNLEPRLRVDAALSGLVCEGVPGVFLGVDPDGPGSEEILSGYIVFIRVRSDNRLMCA